MVTYDFTGQVAFITGGSAGMGAATVRAFAESGAAVAIVDLDGSAATAFAEQLTARVTGRWVSPATCPRAQVRTPSRRPSRTFGRLDMAFNNAGIMLPPVDAAEETAEAFDKIVAVNLRGVWASMKHELVQMRQQGPARSSTAHPSVASSAAAGAPPITRPNTA